MKCDNCRKETGNVRRYEYESPLIGSKVAVYLCEECYFEHLKENCDHEFSYEIDSWTGRGVEGTVRCVKCGAIGGFTADIYLLQSLLAEHQAGEIELPEEVD